MAWSKERQKEYMRRYYQEHKSSWRAYGLAWKASNRSRYNEIQTERRLALKLEAFDAYGGAVCSCCGESLLEGLSLDHVNGNGAKHKNPSGRKFGGKDLYAELKRLGYPPGYQVLCQTCNFAKGTERECPHKRNEAMYAESPY